MRTQADELAREYQRIKFRTPVMNPGAVYAPTAETPFSVSGDHIYIEKINGPGTIQIRLGREHNPWFTVTEGMVIRRLYDTIRIRDASTYTATLDMRTEAWLMCSTGPFIERPFKNKSFKNHFGALTSIQLLTGQWQAFEKVFGLLG